MKVTTAAQRDQDLIDSLQTRHNPTRSRWRDSLAPQLA